MDQKYILSILAVLVGATFGWALKGLTELWQIRRADRKVLKSILYHFLETYRLLKKLNADNLQTGLQKLYAKIPGLSTLANSPEFISYFSSLIFDKQVKFINEDFNTIKVDLASSISTLKTIDP
ncbi:MAG TPA: hypothetical protein VFE53_10975, partial [Mucilaginibacter sp.]|nr:hypothetical protein [Mucilaginibacter sp.]